MFLMYPSELDLSMFLMYPSELDLSMFLMKGIH
jgi:hypothetical protein